MTFTVDAGNRTFDFRAFINALSELTGVDPLRIEVKMQLAGEAAAASRRRLDLPSELIGIEVSFRMLLGTAAPVADRVRSPAPQRRCAIGRG